MIKSLWELECKRLDPAPYRKLFIFENQVLGYCCLRNKSICATGHFGRDHGDCELIFENWDLCSYCGPRFVEKYNLKPLGGDAYD